MANNQTVFVVDDDEGVRDGLKILLQTVGQSCEIYASAFEFLEQYDNTKQGCLVLDIRMPRMTGLDLQEKLIELGSKLPIIFITGHGDIPMAVEAMRQGALDFIRKPFREQDLLDRINEALLVDSAMQMEREDLKAVNERVASLTKRENEIFQRVSSGEMNKVIGLDLGISERTVEAHRSQVMKKLEVKTLAQLIRLRMELDR